MKKGKTARPQIAKEEKPVTLGDMLNKDLKLQLKAKQQHLKEIEEREKLEQKEKEAKRKREERRQKEKNMSFEELLEKNDMDWKNFK